MRVGITGVTGFVGSAVARALTGRGDSVTGIGRGPELDVRWDPAAGVLDAAGLEGLDAVVHLAGAPIGDRRWTARRKSLIRNSRVDGTRLLSETLADLKRPPSVLLSGSAIGVYGSRGEEVLNEESDRGEGFLADVCHDWERAAGAASRAGIRVAYLRTGIVLDRGGGMLARMLPLYRLGLGGRLGSGRQMMSWISLRDEVDAIVWALDYTLSGPINLTAPTPVTNREFNYSLGRSLRRPARMAVPGFVPKAIFGAELVEELILGSARVLPSRLMESGFAHNHANLDDYLAGEVDERGVE